MTAPDPGLLNHAAGIASYVGSVEHKVTHTWLGPKKIRSDATPCPREFKDPVPLTAWLRAAIAAGAVSDFWEGDFPRYVWTTGEDGRCFEARLMNQGLGEYKGYPLDPVERPKGL